MQSRWGGGPARTGKATPNPVGSKQGSAPRGKGAFCAQGNERAGPLAAFARPDHKLDNLGLDWSNIYATKLDNLPEKFIGAEAAMWGEHVDSTNALARVWPRAAALGELLWSPGTDSRPHIPSRNVDRLARWRCRMNARGVPAEPVQPGWCPDAAQ